MTDKQIEEKIIYVLSHTTSLKAYVTIGDLKAVVLEALADQRTQLIQAVEHDDYIYEPIKSRVIKLIEGKE